MTISTGTKAHGENSDPRLAAEAMFSVFPRKTLEYYAKVISSMLERDRIDPFLPKGKT